MINKKVRFILWAGSFLIIYTLVVYFLTFRAYGATIYPAYQTLNNATTSNLGDKWFQTLGNSIGFADWHASSTLYLKVFINSANTGVGGCSAGSGTHELRAYSNSDYTGLVQTIASNSFLDKNGVLIGTTFPTSTQFPDFFIIQFNEATPATSSANYWLWRFACGDTSRRASLGGSDNSNAYTGGFASNEFLPLEVGNASNSPVEDFYFILSDSVDTLSDSYFPTPVNLEAPTSTAFICSDNLNFLADTLCWLFVPAQSSLDRISDLKNSIENKPPFGYLVLIVNTLSSSINQASTSIISTSTISALSGVLNPINTGLVIILWLSLAIWLFHRIRLLDI